ncbi:hypothetical protein [Rheinheimera sp. NSM]|uniref:hypothetical protein n=1 Tax=Rheinheimera sp. NSM TaxID=3457884 RepID=UPI0040367080
MKKYIFIVPIALLSKSAFAYVDCPSSSVKYIQPDEDRVYVQLEGQNWQRLGDYTQPSMNAKLSIALAAHATGKKVKIRFPDGHDASCNTFNNNVNATMIRIENE